MFPVLITEAYAGIDGICFLAIIFVVIVIIGVRFLDKFQRDAQKVVQSTGISKLLDSVHNAIKYGCAQTQEHKSSTFESASSVSEVAQAEDGVAIKEKHFNFTTCEKIDAKRKNVRLLA